MSVGDPVAKRQLPFGPIASVEVSCEMSNRWDNLVKGVQCYVLLGGIALKTHAFYHCVNGGFVWMGKNFTFSLRRKLHNHDRVDAIFPLWCCS